MGKFENVKRAMLINPLKKVLFRLNCQKENISFSFAFPQLASVCVLRFKLPY